MPWCFFPCGEGVLVGLRPVGWCQVCVGCPWHESAGRSVGHKSADGRSVGVASARRAPVTRALVRGVVCSVHGCTPLLGQPRQHLWPLSGPRHWRRAALLMGRGSTDPAGHACRGMNALWPPDCVRRGLAAPTWLACYRAMPPLLHVAAKRTPAMPHSTSVRAAVVCLLAMPASGWGPGLARPVGHACEETPMSGRPLVRPLVRPLAKPGHHDL